MDERAENGTGRVYRGNKWKRLVLAFLAGWMLTVLTLVLSATWSSPPQRAVIGMAWGLCLIWIGGCGFIMWRWRRTWARLLARVPGPWWLTFVLGCVFLALLEEVVTTSMTNLAPLFGVAKGEAYITASSNYFDVVLHHSVVVFVPMFIGWAILLRFWSFSAFSVFILFGLTGVIAETLSFGLQNLGNAGMWIFVYGLMIWLPAFALVPHPKAKSPAWWHYPFAVAFPIFCLPLAAIISPWLWLTPMHPSIHFPPISSAL